MKFAFKYSKRLQAGIETCENLMKRKTDKTPVFGTTGYVNGSFLNPSQ
jgi:hypothetical protein